MKNSKHKLVMLLTLTALLICSGCAPQAQPMDMQVVADIRQPQQGSLALSGRFVATVSAAEEVAVMPLVSGQISEVQVQLGQRVEAGQTLARIDDDAARLQLNSASASYELSRRSAEQSLGASWDMQVLSANSGMVQLQDSINSYYEQIADARESIAELEEQIDDLEDAKDDFDDESDELSDGMEQAREARTAAQTKYMVALQLKNAAELYAAQFSVAPAQAFDALLAADPALAATAAGQGLTSADISETGLTYLKTVFDEADKAYSSLFSLSGAASGGGTGFDTAIAQCESGIKQYETAISQYETAIRTCQQNLATAQQSAALTETQLRQETQAVLDAQLNAAAVGVSSARLALDYYTLTAPIDGVVSAVNVETFDMAAPGYAAFTISNQDSMTVSFSVSQAVRDLLFPGQSVSVEREGLTFEGKIVEIANAAAAYSGLFTVKANVAASGGQLLSGTSVTVTAETYRTDDQALLLPYDAVYYEDDQAYVYCAVEGVARRVEVVVGLYDETTAAIVGGLQPTDLVICSWSPRLRDGAPVRAANETGPGNDDNYGNDDNDSSDAASAL